ncbi:MAG TPA: hypothetical protein VIJ93_01995 [bacterium]
MKVPFIFFILLLGYQSVLADTTADDAKAQEALKGNVVDFRDWLIKKLSQFPKISQGNLVVIPRRYSSIPQKNRTFAANQYNQATKSNWVKAQVMQGLSTLSQQLANTAGTAFAPQSASQLQQTATQLKQSDDPQFQQIGTLYTQEAQALQTGNIQGADQAANQVAAVPQPYVAPGYQPTQQESALAQAFNQVIGALIAGLGGILGTFAVSQLLQALGIPNLSSLLGTGQATGTSLAMGQNPGVAMNNAGANVVQTGGSVALQQLGSVNVKQLQNQGSANAGGAPPAQ